MTIKQYLLVLNCLFIPFAQGIKLSDDRFDEESKSLASSQYPHVVRLVSGAPYASGVLIQHNGHVALLTATHVTRSKKVIISPEIQGHEIYLEVGLSIAHYSACHILGEGGRSIGPDLSICFFTYPDLALHAFKRYGIYPATLDHLTDAPEPEFDALIVDIVGFGGSRSEKVSLNGLPSVARRFVWRTQDDALLLQKQANAVKHERAQKKWRGDLFLRKEMFSEAEFDKILASFDGAILDAKQAIEGYNQKLKIASATPIFETLNSAAGDLHGHLINGDSGGGVFTEDGKLIAISRSTRRDSKTQETIDSFTPLFPYVGWIKDQLENPPSSVNRLSPARVAAFTNALREKHAAG